MVRRVARKAEEAFDVNTLAQQVSEFSLLKERIATLGRRQSELKKELSAAVEEHGVEDDKGHLRLELPEPVEGIGTLTRQRRVVTGFDEDKAVEIIDNAGLHAQCYRTIEVLDEDAVLAAHYEGLLSEEDVDLMFPKSTSYAFVPTK